MWFNFDTSTPGIIFIRLLDCFKGDIDVRKIAEHIIDNAKHSNKDSFQEQQTRFTCRFIPISCLSKASGNLSELDRLIKPIITRFLENVVEEKKKESEAESTVHVCFSMCIEFKNKTNAKVKKLEMVSLIMDTLKSEKDRI